MQLEVSPRSATSLNSKYKRFEDPITSLEVLQNILHKKLLLSSYHVCNNDANKRNQPKNWFCYIKVAMEYWMKVEKILTRS
jgi:hypothetical protein